MQDRFKFRVVYYNDVEKKYFIFEPDLISADGTARAYAYGESGVDEYYDTVTLNQCTGLKDKNDKLIYEGDIVADVVSGCVAIIEYLHSSYSLMAHIRRMDEFVSIEDICFVDKEGTPFEIIGNIYENPELLENKQ